ncbi:MAG: hypothetical protein JRI70_08895, partial [Deltaproteobacteria bacterium]|nr:hypothetical protein [Deltaproteobacteria bacterium]
EDIKMELFQFVRRHFAPMIIRSLRDRELTCPDSGTTHDARGARYEVLDNGTFACHNVSNNSPFNN